MENLVELVNKVQQISVLPVFDKEIFVVQNAGMQHWLSMSLANKQTVSFNTEFMLPAQYLWHLIRLLNDECSVANQEPFSREALSWRIYALLDEHDIKNNELFSQVTHYWLGHSDLPNHLKRYQLACELADLFEQYLVFRPDWIDSWHQNSIVNETNASLFFQNNEQWQRVLWQRLISEGEYNPIKMISGALNSLDEKQHLLPKRIMFFGINALAPTWLSFIEGISDHVQVHFFHLNPCFTYWGDLLTEKSAIKQLSNWTDNLDQLNESVGNPLLANLGQQGREFLSLLQHSSTIDIDAFSTLSHENCNKSSVLELIQQDILTLNDRRNNPIALKDDSIFIASAHSALREVQGLHDWLLHQFNQDKTLTPKDILVMCPQVESYAPYVNAVFSRGWQDLSDDVPPLPCSIADRVAKNADPVVAAFSELLTLPDNRFQVTKVMSWLKVSAIQKRLLLSNDDIQKISTWLHDVNIKWGLDAEHKASVVNTKSMSEQFSWEYGLTRLLLGVCQVDQETIVDDCLTYPNIEANDATLLGKLVQVIEQLKHFSYTMKLQRTPQQWHCYFKELLSSLFDIQHESVTLIEKALDDLIAFCEHANFNQTIDLAIVSEFLNNHFSQPDPGRQFMIGQVTFCSMIPMRSVPFKVIAVLGLNDGEFPRLRLPYSFDLMSQSSARLGDRSRRGDDRYLFLEAIISARNSLYLSYQGKNIKNNRDKQPSIVLNELMDYLSTGFGWRCSEADNTDIHQFAMQPYSPQNYTGKWASFDKNWLSLGLNSKESAVQAIEPCLVSEKNGDIALEESLTITLDELTSFLLHPSRYYAQKQLGLFLDQHSEELSDDEPFVSDFLDRYVLKQRVLTTLLEQSLEDADSVLSNWHTRARLSGNFPALETGHLEIEKLLSDCKTQFEQLRQEFTGQFSWLDVETEYPIQLNNERVLHLKLLARVPIVDNRLVFTRPSTPNAKDLLTLNLSSLVVQRAIKEGALPEKLLNVDPTITTGFYFNSKTQQHVKATCATQNSEIMPLLLKTFINGKGAPLLLNANLAHTIFSAKKYEQSHLEKYWYDETNLSGFAIDPYIHYFWPQCPELEQVKEPLEQLYNPLFSNVTLEQYGG